jgi:molybdopterin-guanine dinucleotide biosynthesis protein A
MGAVAGLLHGFNSAEDRVVLQVADSPFCNFESVCELYAKRFMGIP